MYQAKAKKRTTLAVIASTATALLLVTRPALASPPYTVTVGTSTTGDHAFTASASAQTDGFAVYFEFLDPVSGIISINCTSSTAGGVVHAGDDKNPVADITSITFGGCQFPGGPLSIAAVNPDGSSSLPWSVDGTGPATAATSDDVPGEVDRIVAHAELAPAPLICSFDITGFVTAEFDESTQTLDVSELTFADLTLSNVGPCLGALHNGDAMTFEASYAVASPDGAINLG